MDEGTTTEDGYAVVCPHCSARISDAHDLCANESETVDDCGKCGGWFVKWAEYSVTYRARAIDPPKQEETRAS